jgi:hypothetical protein
MTSNKSYYQTTIIETQSGLEREMSYSPVAPPGVNALATSSGAIYWSKHMTVLIQENGLKKVWYSPPRMEDIISSNGQDGTYTCYNSDGSVFVRKADVTLHWSAPTEREVTEGIPIKGHFCMIGYTYYEDSTDCECYGHEDLPSDTIIVDIGLCDQMNNCIIAENTGNTAALCGCGESCEGSDYEERGCCSSFCWKDSMGAYDFRFD